MGTFGNKQLIKKEIKMTQRIQLCSSCIQYKKYTHTPCVCVCVCVCVYKLVHDDLIYHLLWLMLSFSCSAVSNSFVSPLTLTHQAPLSMEFSRQEYWSRLPFHSPGYLPKPGIELTSPAWQADSLQPSHLGSPSTLIMCIEICTYNWKYTYYTHIYIYLIHIYIYQSP